MSPSTPVTSRTLTLCAALGLLLSACGSPVASPSPIPLEPSPAPSASPGPSQAAAPGLLLEVTNEGGFINPIVTLAAPPLIVVDDDGHIYTPAIAADGTSTGLVASLDVRDVGRDGAARILEAIRAAGLDHEGSGGGIPADAGSTVFTAIVDGTEVVSRYVARGGPGRPGSSGDPAAAFDLLARLTDPTVTWGSAPAPAAAYEPVGYRVFAAPAPPADAAGPIVAWPLRAGIADLGAPAVPDLGIAGLRSVVVTGADAAVLAPVLADATADTAFTSGGLAFRLWVKPLFPDEVGR